MPGEVAPAAGQLAGALGLLDEQGHLNRAFFEHPLDSVRRALVDAKRRALLVQSLDELMERDQELSHSGPDELRAYPLADLDPHRLALALRLPGGTGAATVTLIVLARVVLESGASLDIEVPLVTGEADTLRAVCGTPDGPVRLRGSYPVTDTAVVSAEVTAHTGGGYLGLRLTGLVVDGTEVPPLELRSDALRGDIAHVLTSVLGVAAQALTGGGPAADVLTHLPGVLGLDPLIPPLPLAELARTPGTFRAWLASLLTGDAAGMRAWLGHVAGMAGLTSRLTGRPTPASPWTITIVEGSPTVAVALAVYTAADGADVLELGVRVAVDAPPPLSASLAASCVLVRLPLAGTAPETWFPATTAVLTCPAADDTDPLLATTTLGLGIGRITAGMSADRTGVRPAIFLDGVTFEGRAYPRLDLSNADTLASTAVTALTDTLDDLLGGAGYAADLMVLLGLLPPGATGPTLNLTTLATAPTRAIADYHRALLAGPGWSAPLAALAHLLGVTTPQVDAGTGTWRVRLVDATAASLWLVATAATDAAGTTTLDLSLEATPDGAGTPIFRGRAHLLRFAFGADGSVHTGGLDALALTVSTPAIDAGPLHSDGLVLEAGWSAGQPGRIGAALTGVTLALPGGADAPDPFEPDGAPALALGDLALPWAADPAGPLAGIPLESALLTAILPWAVRRLSAAAGPVWAAVGQAVAAVLPDLLADPIDLPALAADLSGVLRAALAAAGPELGALAGQVLAGAAQPLDGGGTADDPWRWPIDTGSPGVALTGWLAPDGAAAGASAAGSGEPGAAGGSGGAGGGAGGAGGADGDGGSGGADGFDDAGTGGQRDALGNLVSRMTVTRAGWPDLDAMLTGRDLFALAEGLLALDDWAGLGDGLWSPDLADPGGWGTAEYAQALATAPFADPDALDAVVQALGGWLAGGAVPVCVAPAWWPAQAWTPLLAALDGAAAAGGGAALDWLGVDLRTDPVAAIGGLTRAAGYLVVAGESDTDLAAALTAVRQAAGAAAGGAAAGAPVVLAAAATAFAPVAGWVAAQPAGAVAGLLAVAAPLGTAGDPPALDPAFGDPGIPEAVRVAAALLAGTPCWADLAEAWREVVEGQAAPTPMRPAGVGRLPLAALSTSAATAAAAVPTAVPRLALVTAGGTGLLDALDAVLAAGGTSPGPPDALVTGVTVPVALPPPTTPVNGTATVTIDLGRTGFAPDAAGAAGGPGGAPVRVRGRVEIGDDRGWLAGPPAAGRAVAVRRMSVRVDAAFGTAGDAGADIVLHDARVGGVPVPRCRPGDPGFDQALAGAVGALDTAAHGGDAHAAALLALLRDVLGIATDSGTGTAGRFAVDADGLAELLADTAGWLADRASSLLATGSAQPAGAYLGLLADSTAPTGIRRWRRPAAPGLTVVLEKSVGWTLTVALANPGLDLDAGSTLSFTSRATLDAPAATTWALAVPGVTLTRTAAEVTATLAGGQPVRVWPLASMAEAEAVANALLPALPAALAAGLATELLHSLTGIDVPAAGLVELFRDPLGTLKRRAAEPDALPTLVTAVARAVGLPVNADGTITVVDGVLQVGVLAGPDGPRLEAGTPAGGWSPGAGLHLSAGVGLTLGAGFTVTPHGTVGLSVDLPGTASPGAWSRIGLAAELGPSGLRLSVTPTPGQPIELLPHFAGLASLVDAGVDRFLPQVLNALRDAVPAGALRTSALELATAVGI